MSAVGDAAKVLADALQAEWYENAAATRLAIALASAGLLRDGETYTEWGAERDGEVTTEFLSYGKHLTMQEEDARRWCRYLTGYVVVSRERTVTPDRVTEWKPVES